MPPNTNSTIGEIPDIPSDKPGSVCVSDLFHFASYYWKESNASLAGMAGDQPPPPVGGAGDDDSIAGAGLRRRDSFASETDSMQNATADQTVHKVRAYVPLPLALHENPFHLLSISPTHSTLPSLSRL